MAEGELNATSVALAFVVVILAGLSTGIGAAIVFFPRFIKYATRRVLASALGISAGVMMYVSFIEIFVKSNQSFDEHLMSVYDDDDKRSGIANLYATLSFFLGVLINVLLDYLVRKISNEHVHEKSSRGEPMHHLVHRCPSDHDEVVIPHCIGCSPDPVGELHEWHRQAEREVSDANKAVDTLSPDELSHDSSDKSSDLKHPENRDVSEAEHINQSLEQKAEEGESKKGGVSELSSEQDVDANETDEMKITDLKEKKKLVRMGFQTAIAIALHNFPEGLATFIGFLDDPSIGISFAIAIAIHNIPEGLCVALPVYYATGSRPKAFWWGILSGVTEPIGALIGWFFFRNGLNLVLYGLMFGIVGGLMVMISLRELLPTAFRYDPRDTIVTNSVIFGMAVMSLSLVLFTVF